MYKTPDEFYFRLHHVRPRFKNEVESVLNYVAYSIAQIGCADSKTFRTQLNASLRQYGQNATASPKTIENWRTEIGALFGMYIERSDGQIAPSAHTVRLADDSDITAFFLGFVASFQYPGGHVKETTIKETLLAGVAFQPYQWLFAALLNTNLASISASEFCHCALNDLRVTRDHEDAKATVGRILDNRHRNETYISDGDVIRYAGDLLDYAVLAGLLTEKDGVFSLNVANRDIAEMIADSTDFFGGYSDLKGGGLESIRSLREAWFTYVDGICLDAQERASQIILSRENKNKAAEEAGNGKEAEGADNANSAVGDGAADQEDVATPDDTAKIGDCGEIKILQHECLRVKESGRADLVHLIKRIPTHCAVGYDIRSVEPDTESSRLIEVKTTKSHAPLAFRQFHLTKNEWRTAQDMGERYYVYRLMLSEDGARLFVIHDPVQKFRERLVRIFPRDGMDFTCEDAAGEEVKLLCAP